MLGFSHSPVRLDHRPTASRLSKMKPAKLKMIMLLRTKPPESPLPLPSQRLLASTVWSEAVNIANMTMTSARMISISTILRWFLLRVLEEQNRPVA